LMLVAFFDGVNVLRILGLTRSDPLLDPLGAMVDPNFHNGRRQNSTRLSFSNSKINYENGFVFIFAEYHAICIWIEKCYTTDAMP